MRLYPHNDLPADAIVCLHGDVQASIERFWQDTESRYRLLRGDKARPLLRGETEFRVRAETAPARRVSAAAVAPAQDSVLTADEQALFDALRAWRAREAKAQSVPPYVIFHDTVLRGVASARPSDLDALGVLKGVGASKLARYGAAVLGIVARAGSPTFAPRGRLVYVAGSPPEP